MSEEEIEAWVQRHLQDAPERDDAWLARAETVWSAALDMPKVA